MRILKRVLEWVVVVSWLLIAAAALLMRGGPPRISFLAVFVLAVSSVAALPLSIAMAARRAWSLIKCIILYICLLALTSTLAFLLTLPGLPDIACAIRKDYATIEGQAKVENRTTYRSSYQRITIGEITCDNSDVFWQQAKDGRIYTLKYLPNSKIIMEIIGPLDEPEPTPESTATPTTMPKWKRR